MRRKTVGEPRIAISLRLTFRDPPRTYHGLTSESWTIGNKSQPVPLDVLIVKVVRLISEFYVTCKPGETDELNERLKNALAYLSQIEYERFGPKEKASGAATPAHQL